MAMDSVTVTLTDKSLIDGFIAYANRNGITPEAAAMECLLKEGASFVRAFGIGTISNGAFIARLTPDEYRDILAASVTDDQVRNLVAALLVEPNVALDDPRIRSGLELMSAKGLLALERIPQLLHYERQTPAPTPEPA